MRQDRREWRSTNVLGMSDITVYDYCAAECANLKSRQLLIDPDHRI